MNTFEFDKLIKGMQIGKTPIKDKLVDLTQCR